MATLYLLRHAKADGIVAGKTDFDRHLSDKGIRACSIIRQQISDEKIEPDIILCSASVRTRETLDNIMSAWEEPKPVEYLDSVYEAHPEEIRRAIAAFSSTHSSIMVIGHNPGMQMLTMALTGNRSGAAYTRAMTHFPPGGLAKLDVHPALWEDVEPDKFTFLKMLTP